MVRRWRCCSTRSHLSHGIGDRRLPSISLAQSGCPGKERSSSWVQVSGAALPSTGPQRYTRYPAGNHIHDSAHSDEISQRTGSEEIGSDSTETNIRVGAHVCRKLNTVVYLRGGNMKVESLTKKISLLRALGFLGCGNPKILHRSCH